MKVCRIALFASLTTLFVLTAVLAIANPGSTIEPRWAQYEILDHGISSQDISDNKLIYTEAGPPPLITVVDIRNGESQLLEEFYPCGVPQAVHVAGDWLVAEFLCFLAGETLFQSHAYNMNTGESFLLAPDPPIPELPYSWYVDIDDGRVVWSQLADCASGDIYLMDMETRDISKVTQDPGTGARLNLSLGPEWLVWDEYRLDENAASNQVFDVHAANLISGETITVTLSDDGIGNMPLAGDNIIVWNETNTSYLREIWALDLTSRNQYQIEASGDFPFAADLSGDLLVLSDQVSAGGTALDSSFDQPAGIPDEPCDRTRAKAGAHNRLRVYDLVINSDVFLYYNPEARALYEARIDGKTAIWAEWAGQYPNEIDRVLAARRLDNQYYMPLIFH